MSSNLILEEKRESLMKEAVSDQEKAYSPYYKFKVGAELLTKEGKIFTGCNIENVSFSMTICAERTAAFNAVSHGERDFYLVGIVGDFDYSVDQETREKAQQSFVFPCGCCRQVLNEFGGHNLAVVLAKENDEIFVSELQNILPGSFGPKALGMDPNDYSRNATVKA